MQKQEKNLKQKVLREAINLKLHVPNLKQLSSKKLDGNFGDSCLYGQLFGHSIYGDAIVMKNKCAKPYSDDLFEYVKPVNKKFNVNNFSPIEFYICMKGVNKEKRKNLINYLKGKIELTIDDL